jgi:acetoin utilization protein AcuB
VTKVIESLRKFETRIISILTSFEDAPEGKKRVAIRVMIDDPAQEEAMTKELRDTFTVVYHGKDELKNMPRKRAV